MFVLVSTREERRMRFAASLMVCLSAAFVAGGPVAQAKPLPPDNLRTEYVKAPLGIDTASPRFSWWMREQEQDQFQSAYRVQVATCLDLLKAGTPDCWDSGKVLSDNSVHVVYNGQPLASSTAYYWRVCTWDKNGKAGDYSEVASFETALLTATDFNATWVTVDEDITGSGGYQSETVDSADKAQWVRIELDEPREISGVVLYPARPLDGKENKAGFGFPVRYKVTVSDMPGGGNGKVVADCTAKAKANPGGKPVRYSFPAVKGKFVRVAAEQLAENGAGKYVLALAEIEVLDPQGKNVALEEKVTASTRVDGPFWGRAKLVDGITESREGRQTSPLLRKEFPLEKPVKSARAYVSGLGYYELYLNGQRVGDRVLDPGNTVHYKRTLYSTYDVTALLKPGGNAAGLMLGHGWWKGTCAGWLQLRVEFTDGSTQSIATDDSWRWSTGAILRESFYHGERYDARLEQAGWNEAGFNDGAWKAVRRMETPPEKMMAEVMPPIRVNGTVKPVSLTPRPGGSFILDFGQNLTGWIQLNVRGEAGQQVTIKHTELLRPDGSLNPDNLRSAQATDTYILKGGGTEVYHPRFTQHGFRYAEVFSTGAPLTIDQFEAQVVHSAFDTVGGFECSNPLYNKIRDISLWSILGNNMSMPTDCPQRDERMGWMGDAHLAAEATILNFDVAAYYQNWLRVIADSQSPDGFVPDTAPHIWGDKDGSPPWAIAYPLVTWYSWRYYGNRRAVEENYPNIVKWFNTLEAKSKNNTLDYCHYGDWVGVEETPMPPIGTACFYWTAAMLEEFAGVLGKTADQQHYAQRKQAIGAAYDARFFNKEKGCYDEGSQCSQILPLYLGIAGGHQAAALKRLTSEIAETRKGHLATGILGTKYLFDVLADSGNAGLAYQLSLQEDYPSWGYMIANGATTLWELWKLETGNGMNSHNHQMFGSILDWFHGHVAGIGKLPEAGYRHFTIAPLVDGPLTRASAHLDTVRGRISSAWEKKGGGFDLQIEIPANTGARVEVPTLGKKLSGAPKGLRPAQIHPDRTVLELGSGSYRFSVR